MDDDASLAQVKRLLGLLPGVELAWTQKTPAFIRLGLTIEAPRSVALIAHVAVAANVPLHVEIDWNCPGGHDEPDCVRYDLRVPLECNPSEPPTNLQLVGGMLARQLTERGVLDLGEANQLLRAWNFAVE